MFCFRPQQCQVRERRESCRFALHQFRFGERVVAAVDQGQQQRVLGMVRLQHDLAASFRATGTTGDLDQQLREFLAGAEVGAEQALVDADHRDEGEVRQVMALRQHLRADQDAGRIAEFGQQRFQCIAAAGAAAIHA